MSEISCPLHDIARMAPNQLGWMEGGRGYSYPVLHQAARRIQRRLIDEFGLKPGDRVVVCAPAEWRWVPLLYACLRARVIFCPLNTRLPAAARTERARGLAPALQICADGGEPMLSSVPCLRMGELCDATFLDAGGGGGETLDLEVPATCLYTTGSMGNPRALVHTLEAHYYSALGANRNLPMNHRHRCLLSLPLYHVGGLAVLFRCMMSGTGIVLPEAGQDPADAVLEHRITHLSVVPTQLIRLLADARAPQIGRQLQCVLLGGAPIPRDLVRRALEAGFPVHPTYGMTETASQVCTTGKTTPTAKRQSTDGAVLDHRMVRVNTDGEILVRGHVLAAGEWRDGSVQPLTLENDWLPTGDLGTLEEGYLTVTGRKDNRFISGGENIQPEEIERALQEITGADTVVVTPRADAEFGARPVAWLGLEPEEFEEEEWTAHLREKLPGYMIPVAYRPLPPGSGLKPDRAALRELG
jgi:O-succinylbenzoic acid--CoA ligase